MRLVYAVMDAADALMFHKHEGMVVVRKGKNVVRRASITVLSPSHDRHAEPGSRLNPAVSRIVGRLAQHAQSGPGTHARRSFFRAAERVRTLSREMETRRARTQQYVGSRL